MEKTIYEQLFSDDWVRVFEREMRSGTIKLDDKLKFYSRQIVGLDNPWIFNDYLTGVNPLKICNAAHLYFNAEMNFIHSYCHKCFKVVVKPRTVKELFTLQELQQTMDRPAKAGIEIRGYVPKLYGGYFYNRGLSNGQECYKVVRKLVDEKISPDVDVILKKGCTEFEMKYGDSDKWAIVPGQEEKEVEFEKIYSESESPTMVYPKYLTSHKKREWLHWASDHYDETVKEFTGGQWLTRGQYYADFIKAYLFPQCKYVTYHEEIK